MRNETADPILLKKRRQWAAANARRRDGTQVPMVEYRAKIAAEAAERRAQKRAARQVASAARKALRLAEAAARREATKTDRVARQRANGKAWREANRDRMRELVQHWKKANPEKKRAANRNRKMAKRVTLTRELMKLQRGRCAYCRKKLDADFHVDHVMPLKLEGPDKRSNLQLACPPCNLSKNARHPIEFAQSLGMLL